MSICVDKGFVLPFKLKMGNLLHDLALCAIHCVRWRGEILKHLTRLTSMGKILKIRKAIRNEEDFTT